MITIKNDKVYLTEEDYNAIKGIYSSSYFDLGRCVELLKTCKKYYTEFKQDQRCYVCDVDDNVTDYKKLFEDVFVKDNYEVVGE